MSHFFTILPSNAKRTITASVGFVSPVGDPGSYAIIRNKRGWDIPGGHVEDQETPLQAFKREIFEETGCQLLPGANVIAILESKTNSTTGIAVYRGVCSLAESFTGTDEIFETKFVTKKELLEIYFGDKKLLGQLLKLITIGESKR
jgi:8-oxo-dGTP pyrophosphatase MutT (NUDIX family)